VRALILAGGLGTRLRPLTLTRPKHLLPIANRPHIEHLLGLLDDSGVREAVLMTSYLADAFSDTVDHARDRGFTMHVTHEEEPLGTAGAIKNAEDFARDGTCLVFNGDVLTDVDLNELVSFHRTREAEATILLTPVDDPSRFGIVPTDEDGRVQTFIEKPPPGEATTNLINAGVYVFEPSVLDRIPAGEVWSTEHQLFPGLVAEGAALFATALEGYWRDIGTAESLLEGNLDALNGSFRTDAVTQVGQALVDATAGVAGSARVETSCIGAKAEIEADAVIERSVLLSGVKVGRGARVEGSILGADVIVAAGATALGVTLGDGDSI
jgi:mannose-1-phosphate guanylyltransferase